MNVAMIPHRIIGTIQIPPLLIVCHISFTPVRHILPHYKNIVYNNLLPFILEEKLNQNLYVSCAAQIICSRIRTILSTEQFCSIVKFERKFK